MVDQKKKWLQKGNKKIWISKKDVRESLLLAILQILGFRDAFEINSKTTIRIAILRTAVEIVFNLLLIALFFVNPYLSMILYLGFPIVSFIVSIIPKFGPRPDNEK